MKESCYQYNIYYSSPPNLNLLMPLLASAAPQPLHLKLQQKSKHKLQYQNRSQWLNFSDCPAFHWAPHRVPELPVQDNFHSLHCDSLPSATVALRKDNTTNYVYLRISHQCCTLSPVLFTIAAETVLMNPGMHVYRLKDIDNYLTSRFNNMHAISMNTRKICDMQNKAQPTARNKYHVLAPCDAELSYKLVLLFGLQYIFPGI